MGRDTESQAQNRAYLLRSKASSLDSYSACGCPVDVTSAALTVVNHGEHTDNFCHASLEPGFHLALETASHV